MIFLKRDGGLKKVNFIIRLGKSWLNSTFTLGLLPLPYLRALVAY